MLSAAFSTDDDDDDEEDAVDEAAVGVRTHPNRASTGNSTGCVRSRVNKVLGVCQDDCVCTCMYEKGRRCVRVR